MVHIRTSWASQGTSTSARVGRAQLDLIVREGKFWACARLGSFAKAYVILRHQVSWVLYNPAVLLEDRVRRAIIAFLEVSRPFHAQLCLLLTSPALPRQVIARRALPDLFVELVLSSRLLVR